MKTTIKKSAESWIATTVGEVTTVSTGGTPNTQKEEYWDGNIPWMSSGEVNFRRVKQTEKKITELGLKNCNSSVFPKGTVMMALAGQGSTRGKVAVLEIESACNQSLAAIQSRDENRLLNDYLFYNLESRYAELRNINSNAGRAGLNLALIKKIPITLPTSQTQKKITDLLLAVDRQIEATDEILSLYSKLRRGLMDNFFSVSSGSKPTSHTKIKDIARVLGGKRLPAGHDFSLERTGHAYIRVVDFKDLSVRGEELKYITEQTHQQIKKYIINRHDVYISIAGTIGRVGIVPSDLDGANLTENAARIVLNSKDDTLRDYVMYFLSSRLGQKQIDTLTVKTTQPKLALNKIEQIVIPVPNKRERLEQVVSILGVISGKIIEEKYQKNLYLQAKRGLMQDLFQPKRT